MRRFYKEVSVAPFASSLEGEADSFERSRTNESVGGTSPRTADAVRHSLKGRVDFYCILLDGKKLRTPARAELILPNQRLAEAIAEEWRAQGEILRPDTMPLTRLANTAVDRVAPARAEMVERIMAFGRSDLVCYRAESPGDLVARQAQLWDPLLTWLRDRHGAELRTRTGIAFIEQPEKALRALTRAIEAHDDFQLAALYAAASLSGSLVIALALAEGRLDANAAFAAAHLDEAYQAEKWGADAETQAHAARVAAELIAAERFLTLLKKS